MSNERLHGTVKMWNDTRGFGFLQRSGAPDVFVHFSSILVPDGASKRLYVGQEVTFEVGQDPRGGRTMAINVTPGSVPTTSEKEKWAGAGHTRGQFRERSLYREEGR